MKKYFIFFSLIYFILIPVHFSLGASTTGFIPGQIWYSKSPLVEGDTVKIYTALFNSGPSSLSARIEFYDKNVILGSRDIVVLTNSLKDVSISWKVTSGDHSISAKITSSSITTSGKKENVTISNSTTETDKRFIPVVLNTVNGKPATSGDIVKSQLDKATSSLDSIVPESISNPVSDNVGAFDSFRADTLAKITETKIEAKSKIAELNSVNTKVPSKANGKVVSEQKNVGVADATEKPITYLKLFFFSILSFVFGSKLVFYFLIILILFFVTRGIYRKIRNR